MNSNRHHETQTAPKDKTGRKLKRTSSFMLGQLIVSLAGLPLATSIASAQSSTTCTSSSSSCVDLYAGTVFAIQAYGYQPPSLSSNTGQSIGANWVAQNFSGGTLDGSEMVFTLPADQGQPTQSVLWSTYVYSCPGGGQVQGSITQEVSISNTTEITSDQSVENSSSTFMNASASVNIGYKPPSTTGGVNGSVTGTYEWGTESDTSTATSSGTANSTDTASVQTLTYNYNIPDGSIQLVSISAQTTAYNNVNWSSNITLTGTLSAVYYAQMFKSTQPPAYTTQSLNGSNIPANVWYPPMVWSSQNADALASPSGAYVFFPNWTADLVEAYLKSSNNATLPYYQGAWNKTTDQGMLLRLDTGPCTGGCAGTFWATNLAGNTVAWDSNTSPAYLAMQDDGNLVGYNTQNQAIWNSKSGQGVATAPQNTPNPVPQPSALLPNNGQAFTATGLYNATTYDSTATIGGSAITPMTQDQINTYCGGATTTSGITSQSSAQFASTPETEAGYVLMKASYDPKSFILAQQDVQAERDRGQLRRDVQRERDGRTNRDVQQAPDATRLNDQSVIKKDVDPADPRKKLGKLKKLKSPMVLKPNQYYTANLLGFKVKKVTVRSDNLSNYVGFAPGPANLTNDTFAGGSRTVKLKVGERKKFSVKPRTTI